MKPITKLVGGAAVWLSALMLYQGQAQVLFSDDWGAGTLDTTKWRVDTQPFESGTSDVTPTVAGGYLTFAGTDTAGWWGGAAVATIPTFNASPETNLIFTVDRNSEFGTGTAHRSAIWITDTTRTHYVLFGDDQGEGSWHYNRMIGAAGDNPNGTGTAVPALDQAPYNDMGDHVIKAIVNGQTVKLYVDDVFGAEVAFPFATGIVFEIASYARAVNDTAGSMFGPVSVTAAQTVMFSDAGGNIENTAQLLAGATSTNIFVRIPAGQNATQPFTVTVTTSDPTVAAPVGAAGGTLTVTFPAGGPNIQAVPLKALTAGGATITLQNSAGVLVGNSLQLLVPYSGAGVVFQDNFPGTTFDTSKWQVNNQGFETGTGNMTISVTNNQLVIGGGLSAQYWGGISLKTTQSYVATKDLNLVFDLDCDSIAYTGTAGRRGVYITTGDRSQFVFVGQDDGETGWEVNSTSGGNPTGGGTAIAAFSALNDAKAHHLRLVANGSTVSFYLDTIYGGQVSFPVASGIYFEIGAYARAQGDTVQDAYANAEISTVYSPITVAPLSITSAMNQTPQTASVIISPALIYTNSATVTVTSSDPTVAIPAGAVNGVLALTFPAGGSATNIFQVTPVGVGTTTFVISNTLGVAVANNLSVTVTEPLFTLLSDDFSAGAIDTSKWDVDTQPLEINGSLTNNSYIVVTNGVLRVYAVSGGVGDAAGLWWGGLGLATKELFAASPTAPVSFEVDRVSHVGTGAARRTAIMIADATRQNWVLFSDDDLTGGWVYNTSAGGLRANNTIAAFADPKFNDLGDHRMKLEANGSTVKLYLDGVLGTEVPFAYTQGIKFEVGGYARSYPDSILGTFDNALVTGPIPPIYTTPTSLTIEAAQSTNSVVTLTVPSQMHQTNTAHVTITSGSPAVAIPVGGAGGSLTLTFAPGDPDQKTFEVSRVGKGVAVFTFADDQGVPATNTLTVVAPNGSPTVLFSDNFNAGALSSQWVVNARFKVETSWDSSATASAAVVGGWLELNLTVVSNYWPGITVTTATNFQASLVDPVIFEMDRVDHLDNIASGGTGTRSGVYLYDATGTNFVLFANDSETPGWNYNRSIGQAGDNPTGAGTTIAAFSDPSYLDYGQHHMKVVANGQTADLYLDGVFGVEVPFPFSTGLKFAVMAAGRAVNDTITADFDNVTISGSNTPISPAQMTIASQNGNIVIAWTGTGTLQQADAVIGPWSTVTGAVSPFTIPAASLAQQKFYRVVQ